jgi:aminoglycoside phosphotransferase (APT) family kinase protein
VELSNVVFRDGIAVALIDFEAAAPGRPVYDLAQFARLCVPIEDDFDQARMGWRPADRPARLRLIADVYGLDEHGRTQLHTAMDDALDRIEAAARRGLEGRSDRRREPDRPVGGEARGDAERGDTSMMVQLGGS